MLAKRNQKNVVFVQKNFSHRANDDLIEMLNNTPMNHNQTQERFHSPSV